MSPQVEQKLEAILESEFDLIKHNLIYKDNDRYVAFNRYTIVPGPYSVSVSRHHNPIAEFTSLKTALSWCIADKYQQETLAQSILRLDGQCGRLAVDVALTQRSVPRIKNPEQRETVKLKLDHKKAILNLAQNRLEECTGLAKYWQIRGFNNEIARTRRPAPIRTHSTSNRKPSWV
jgi:hypothetical protein